MVQGPEAHGRTIPVRANGAGGIKDLGTRIYMQDKRFELYKKKVYEKIKEIDHEIIPANWWDTVIKYYYTSGYSEERAAHTILETLRK